MLFVTILVFVVLSMTDNVLCESCHVWPEPKSCVTDGTTYHVDTQVRLRTNAKGTVLDNAFERTLVSSLSHVSSTKDGRTLQIVNGTIDTIDVQLDDVDDVSLNMRTNQSYEILIRAPTTIVRASTIYGAMYGLETLSQLMQDGFVVSGAHIKDEPDYAWRGLMIDSGRRFVPPSTLKNLMDTMGRVKLNVLHLHASDMCRFGVESLLYPNLTASLTGIHGGFYTQDDIRDLVGYGQDRGIRIVPEFDIPGHSRGFIPIESKGIEFCEPHSPSRSQLHGTNATYDVLYNILGEMAQLFPDEVFNIGSDETAVRSHAARAHTHPHNRILLTTSQRNVPSG